MNYNDMLVNFYKEQGCNTDIIYNFYYDETNNYIKFQFKKDKELNINNFLKKYCLGGITLPKQKDCNMLWNELQSALKIKGELKFKQINSGKTDTFTNCMRGRILNKILLFLNEKDIYLHCFTHDNLYDVIIDIVDSLLLEKYEDTYDFFQREMKCQLYLFVLKDIGYFVDILKESNYPNIIGKNIKNFCSSMFKWINMVDTDGLFGLECCRQLFREYSKKDHLIFWENNKDGIIIDGYQHLNFDMCIKFRKSFHCFDEISEVQSKFKKLNITNYTFIDSEKCFPIQIADTMVGLLNKFFEFVDTNSYEDIITIFYKMSDIQKQNFLLFLKLYKKSLDVSEFFMCFYEPESVVNERNVKIFNIVSSLIQ